MRHCGSQLDYQNHHNVSYEYLRLDREGRRTRRSRKLLLDQVRSYGYVIPWDFLGSKTAMEVRRAVLGGRRSRL